MPKAETWVIPPRKSSVQQRKPNRDEIFHTAFLPLWANLLNHKHLITKLSTKQLVAVVAKIKYLGFGDPRRLNIFILLRQLFTSIVFIRRASFLWENLPSAIMFLCIW